MMLRETKTPSSKSRFLGLFDFAVSTITYRMRRGRWRDLLLGYHDVLGSLLRRRGQQLRIRVSVGVGVEGGYGHRGAL